MGYYEIVKSTPGGTVKKPKPKKKNKIYEFRRKIQELREKKYP